MSRLVDLLDARKLVNPEAGAGTTSARVVELAPSPGCRCARNANTITSPDATFNGLRTEEHQDPHRPQLDELCIDIRMTESLKTSCGLSPRPY